MGDILEDIDIKVKENSKWKKVLTENIQEIQDTMKTQNLRIIRLEESEDPQFEKLENTFNKMIEENSLNLKKEMAIKIQEAYRI
jgi:predicted RNA-binding protein with RPS1 domain